MRPLFVLGLPLLLACGNSSTSASADPPPAAEAADDTASAGSMATAAEHAASPTTARSTTVRPGPGRPAEMEGGGYTLRLQVGSPQPRPAAPPVAPTPTDMATAPTEP